MIKAGANENRIQVTHKNLGAIRQPLNICVDIDGTVTEPNFWLKQANAYFHKQIRPEEVNQYSIARVLEVTDQEYQAFYHQFGVTMHRNSQVRDHAAMVIQRLYRHHWIHFVTAREEKMRQVSRDWLGNHQIPMHSLHLLGTPNKVVMARELSCDLFIEDSYANAIQLAAAGFKVALIDCLYNREPLPERVARVDNWLQVEAMIVHHFNRSCQIDQMIESYMPIPYVPVV